MLEKETQKIIEAEFEDTIEINKIVIPIDRNNKSLRYARVFFYVSNLQGASRKVKSKLAENERSVNEYELVLSYIEKLLNDNVDFHKYAHAEIYEYTKKNKSNILHIKGIKNKSNEDPLKLAE